MSLISSIVQTLSRPAQGLPTKAPAPDRGADFEETLARADGGAKTEEAQTPAVEQEEQADEQVERDDVQPDAQADDAAERDAAEKSAEAVDPNAVVVQAVEPAQPIAVDPVVDDVAPVDVDQEASGEFRVQPTGASSSSQSQLSFASSDGQPAPLQQGKTVVVQIEGAAVVGAAASPSTPGADGPAGPVLPPPPPEREAPVDPNVARVARGLQSALSQQGGAVTLRLHPPELGVVRIDVDIREGVVRANFQTQHDSVRSLLQQQIGHLRTALEGQGLVVDRMEVQTQNQSQETGTEQQGMREEAGHGRSRGRRDDASQQQDQQDQADARRSSFTQALLNLVG